MSIFESAAHPFYEHDEDRFGTAERPAYYPFGAWGDGYLVDTQTDAALAAYSAWSGRITLTIYMLAISARYFVFRSLTLGVALAVGCVMVIVIGALARAHILRHAPKVRIRASAEDLVRWEVIECGRTYLLRLNVGLLIFFSVLSVILAIVVDGADRWFIALAMTAFVLASIVKIARIWRVRVPEAADGRA